jgi:hypothetical protein
MRRVLTILTILSIPLSCRAASPFLWEPGIANSGLHGAAVTLIGTELNSLAAGAISVSAVGGSGGVFSNANSGQVIWSPMLLTLGATAGAIQTGGNLSCWFLQSVDGATFEGDSAAPPRAPDVVFPLPATVLSGSNIFMAQGLVRIPALRFKVLCQNNSGQTLSATGNTIVLAPTAVQY